MTPKRYFFIVLLFLYTPLFIKGYANTTKEFSDVIVPEFPLQVKFANELVDLDRLDMYERFDRELTTLCYMHSSTSLAIKRANRYFPILEPILKDTFGVILYQEQVMQIERRESPDRFFIFGRY